ncbi:MAG: glycosyltransferase family 2 protein [Nitrososphaera sp.]
MEAPLRGELLKRDTLPLSIIVPTYNESENISLLLDSILESVPAHLLGEIIIVDDNSPDGTGDIADEYASRHIGSRMAVRVIRRPGKLGLSSAILEGFRNALGRIILVMDSDMSHPPQTIPSLLREFQNHDCDIVVASRYLKGGSVIGWPFKRRLLSKGATKIAKYGLGIRITDPMSGFFAFRRDVIQDITFDPIGYKMLLEMIVKAKTARIKEVPYIFRNRTIGSSKLEFSVIIDYMRSVWSLYRYGKGKSHESRTSVNFLSKAGRFYTVGASGLLVNYVVSLLFQNLLPEIWFLHATIVGILFSVGTNFVLNKLWTFEDRDFRRKRTAIQFGLFAGFSSVGAVLQLSLVYALVQVYHVAYAPSLIVAVAAASVGNFLLNKKWTFREKIWS